MIGIIDIHCHIISGVDDGAKTLEESKAMLKLAYAQGVRTIIATPHFRRGLFECPINKISDQYQALKDISRQMDERIKVFQGCEYFAEIGMAQVSKMEPRYTMAGTTYVLAEFSRTAELSSMRAILRELISSGYKPILAHIERCECLHQIQHVKELAKLGVLMQVNADSVLGEGGNRVKKFCQKLIKENLLSFIATDAHGSKVRPPNIAKCANYLESKMGYDYAKKILIDNPQKIVDEISGEYK